MAILRLSNPVKKYAWGSLEFIPNLLGIPPVQSEPVAELWMGAHATDSSLVAISGGEISLRDYLLANPSATLGRSAELHGDELPFLLKILAARQPLSIQAHPTAEQARLGFARENSLGIPLSAPERNYRDPNPKPELLCALTKFTALCGFRPYAEILNNFRAADLDVILPAFAGFSRFPDQRHLQLLLTQLLHLTERQRSELTQAFSRNLDDGTKLPQNLATICLNLLEQYPNDPGVIAPLYLNLFELLPGQAIFLGSGVLHAYLEGAGIELMANSDNVLRGGLTPKHVDPGELARVLNFQPNAASLAQPAELQPGILRYPAPTDLFALYELNSVSSEPLSPTLDRAPAILLCTEGSLRVSGMAGEIQIKRGEAVFADASERQLGILGPGKGWLATLPPV